MPLQSAGARAAGQRHSWHRPAGASRSAEPALPELHPLSSEGAWILREPGLVQMRFLLALLLIGCRRLRSSRAQQRQARCAAASEPRRKPDEQAEPAGQQPPKPDEKAASPAPSTEQWITGSVDFGYRWVTDVRGNFPAVPQRRQSRRRARSCSASTSPSRIPRSGSSTAIDVRAIGWGGDPYNTAHVDARKHEALRLHASTTGTSPISTPFPRSPIPFAPRRLQRAIVRYPPPQRQLRAAISSPASDHSLPGLSSATPATAAASRPGC